MITLQCKFNVLELIRQQTRSYKVIQNSLVLRIPRCFLELGNRLLIGEVHKLSEIKHDKKNWWTHYKQKTTWKNSFLTSKNFRLDDFDISFNSWKEEKKDTFNFPCLATVTAYNVWIDHI